MRPTHTGLCYRGLPVLHDHNQQRSDSTFLTDHVSDTCSQRTSILPEENLSRTSDSQEDSLRTTSRERFRESVESILKLASSDISSAYKLLFIVRAESTLAESEQQSIFEEILNESLTQNESQFIRLHDTLYYAEAYKPARLESLTLFAEHWALDQLEKGDIDAYLSYTRSPLSIGKDLRAPPFIQAAETGFCRLAQSLSSGKTPAQIHKALYPLAALATLGAISEETRFNALQNIYGVLLEVVGADAKGRGTHAFKILRDYYNALETKSYQRPGQERDLRIAGKILSSLLKFEGFTDSTPQSGNVPIDIGTLAQVVQTASDCSDQAVGHWLAVGILDEMRHHLALARISTPVSDLILWVKERAFGTFDCSTQELEGSKAFAIIKNAALPQSIRLCFVDELQGILGEEMRFFSRTRRDLLNSIFKDWRLKVYEKPFVREAHTVYTQSPSLGGNLLVVPSQGTKVAQVAAELLANSGATRLAVGEQISKHGRSSDTSRFECVFHSYQRCLYLGAKTVQELNTPQSSSELAHERIHESLYNDTRRLSYGYTTAELFIHHPSGLLEEIYRNSQIDEIAAYQTSASTLEPYRSDTVVQTFIYTWFQALYGRALAEAQSHVERNHNFLVVPLPDLGYGQYKVCLNLENVLPHSTVTLHIHIPCSTGSKDKTNKILLNKAIQQMLSYYFHESEDLARVR